MRALIALSFVATVLGRLPPAEAAQQNIAGVTIYSFYPQPDGSFILLFNEPSMNANSPCLGPLFFDSTVGRSYKYYSVKAGENGVTNDGVRAMLAVSLLVFGRGPSGPTMSVVFDDTNVNSHCAINRFSTP